jgi:starch-binding outer membrane protein, SusD/RagB family
MACRDELDVRNPNQPTPESAATETGIYALGQGGVYISGFRGLDSKFNDGVPGFFWTGAVGIHEIMGDAIGVEAANWFLNQIGCPDEIVLDNGDVVKNPQSPNQQFNMVRSVNDNANGGSNPTFHEWANMYSLNNACNNILSIVENVTFAQDGDSKKRTIQAWAYWWKGIAYSRIGSIYYAGVINSEPNQASNVYVSKEAIIAEATANFDQAASILGSLGAGGSGYERAMSNLIPSYIQGTPEGGIPTPQQWIACINSYKARNILVNTPTANMTSAQWSEVTSLATAGIRAGDNMFIGRSNDNGDIWSASGILGSKVTGSPNSITYKLSERLIQDFKAGDQRLANNFNEEASPWIGNADRGTIFNTRWGLADGGNGIAGTIVLGSRTPGALALYLGCSYEENQLMLAEAKINTGDVEGGLTLIDEVRAYQGAGVAAVAGTGLSAADAKEELRKERRVGLFLRGLSFYDARRWGVIESGRTGCVVIDGTGTINTNATIRYKFLDYWDVPDNELSYNPAGAGSAPTSNPK